YLRAMGLSRPGFMRSALIEHGIVAVIGVVVGVASGLVASRIAVGAIAHSETGRALLPPFILQTNWWPVLTILVIAAVAGIVGVVSSFIGFLRTPLHELTRSTE
ncbi:MAG: FtsX-like permease family protein, partial [Gemmatimonadota bacterium]